VFIIKIEKINIKNRNVFVFSTSAAEIDLYNKKYYKITYFKWHFIKGSFHASFFTNEFLKLFGGSLKVIQIMMIY